MTSLLENDLIKSITSLPYVKDLPDDFNSKTHGRFEIIDYKAGDLKVIWDRTKADEVDVARETFNKLKKKGYAFFLVKGENGDKGDKITEFDPNAERLIAIAPLAGG